MPLRGIGAYGSPDSELKMQFSRCDLHPLYLLRSALADIGSSSSTEAGRLKALHCTKATCNRYYAPDVGYYYMVDIEAPDCGTIETKPSCGLDHERRYMVLTKINGRFQWACPEAGCSNAFPYESSER
jgi:hypothetical protein